MNERTKSLFLSTTFWGVILGMAGHLGLFTWLSSKTGIPIPVDNQALANNIVGVLGDMMAIYGRITATTQVHVIPASTGSSQGGFASVKMLVLAAITALLVACAVTPQTPAQAVYATQGAYASALTIAVAYKQLPDCARPTAPKLCSDRAVVTKLQDADDKAYAALQTAQTLVRSPNAGFNLQTAIAAANAAVGLLTQITANLPVK